ncbi:MAG: hypothetical protein L6R41_005840 [Letrouitia leprolyta]|nr:MAG: hypothetical protein L6R41_005840 [Letrouitia leprolyta]
MSSAALCHRLLRPAGCQLRATLRPSISPPTGVSRFLERNAASSATGGDLGNPQSTSSDQAQVKSSRATDSASSPDTASVQQPVSNRSKIPGDQDEGTDSHDNVKQDPSKPAEEKRKSVEGQGNKPLGPEDHQ